jgi:hypothetical protein
VRENQTLIHLSERFLTLGGYLQKWPKFRGVSEVSPILYICTYVSNLQSLDFLLL